MSLWTDKFKEFGCLELFVVLGESAAEAHPFAGNEWRLRAADKSAAWDIYEVSASSPLVTIKLAPSGGPDKYGITRILGDQPKCCRNSDSIRSAS